MDDNDELNGRIIVQWKGLDPYEDLNSLADAIAKSTHLFNRSGAPVWLKNGKILPVGRDALNEIIAANIVIERLVNHGSDTEENWAVHYTPFEASESIIRTLITAPDRKSGNLAARLPIFELCIQNQIVELPRQIRLQMASRPFFS